MVTLMEMQAQTFKPATDNHSDMLLTATIVTTIRIQQIHLQQNYAMELMITAMDSQTKDAEVALTRVQSMVQLNYVLQQVNRSLTALQLYREPVLITGQYQQEQS